MNILTDDNTISFEMEMNVKSEESKGALKQTDLDGETVFVGADKKVHSKQYDDTEVREQIESIRTSSDVLPQYAQDEMQMVLNKLMAYSGLNNPIVIGFNTDQHLHTTTSSGSKIENDVLIGLKTLKELTFKFPFNIVVLGGDASSSTSSEEMVQSEVLKVTNALKGCDAPLFSLVGNHDGIQNAPTLKGGAVIKSHLTSPYKEKYITQKDLNAYYDDETTKIRFICLRSQAINDYTLTITRRFLENALLTLPSEYEAIIFSHHPVGNLTDGHSTRQDWNEPLNWGEIVNPYADKIICCINGHTHNNLSDFVDGILYISTTCAGRYELNDGSTRPTGTVDATAYDVYVIDRDTHVVHCIRYGNGEDRDLVYYVARYTNQIPISTDRDGNVYNEKGFKENVRLNSSGTETKQDKWKCTGFIPCKKGDIIRLKDCKLTITNVTADYIVFYNSNLSVIRAAYPKTFLSFDESGSSWRCEMHVDDNDYVKEFKVLPYTDNGADDVSYIRISANGINENSVITVNEEIN